MAAVRLKNTDNLFRDSLLRGLLWGLLAIAPFGLYFGFLYLESIPAWQEFNFDYPWVVPLLALVAGLGASFVTLLRLGFENFIDVTRAAKSPRWILALSLFVSIAWLVGTGILTAIAGFDPGGTRPVFIVPILIFAYLSPLAILAASVRFYEHIHPGHANLDWLAFGIGDEPPVEGDDPMIDPLDDEDDDEPGPPPPETRH